MVRLYLDIETYRPSSKDAFTNENIIAIGVLEDFTPYSSKSLNFCVGEQIFTEWETGSEENIIKNFYRYIEAVSTGGARFIVVVGFNILRMDIPLLVQKGVKYKVASISKLNKLWHNTFTIDILQSLLPANQFMFKGLTLSRIFEVLRNELGYVNAPKLEYHGEKVARAYEEKRYTVIENWLKEDLYATRYLDLSGAIGKLIEYSVKKGKPIFK
ncbi:MAG: hypothetical protein DRJ30_07160 [Candidatus Methanomethylicota archaeon]|nr:MAG: hypothetical protein DRJ30_07160 [Candidatus Verstraetearchaeota archaeon]